MDTELVKHLQARDFAIRLQLRHLRWFLILRYGTDIAAQLTILAVEIHTCYVEIRTCIRMYHIYVHAYMRMHACIIHIIIP